MKDWREIIEDFLACGPYAVIGASRDRSKYGNKVLRCYVQHGKRVHPINPWQTEIEGLPCHPDLRTLPEPVRAVSVITPPVVTERIVEDLPAADARFVWMQPGAESAAAVARAEELGVTVIAGGPCVLVAMGFRE